MEPGDPNATPLAAVFFDWDGTLVDSAPATYRCYKDLFAGYGIPFDHGRFESTYAPDWYATYRLVGLPRHVWAEADARWLAAYATETAPMIDGAAEALKILDERGLALGLVTSGSRQRVDRELLALGLERYLTTLVCAGEAARPKPAPEPLLLGLERLGVRARDAAYVGDSPEDVRMAREAGVYSVGIPGGFPNRTALQESRPDFLAASLAAAADHLLERQRGR